MPGNRRWPTALCLLTASGAAALGLAAAWSNLSEVNWSRNPLAAAMLAAGSASPVLLPLAFRRVWRNPPPAGAVLRWTFCATVFLWFAYTAAAGAYYRARVACVFATWASVVAAAVLVAPSTPRRPPAASLAALGVAFLLLLGEVSLRTLALCLPGPLWSVTTAGSAQRLRAFAFVPGDLHFGSPINEFACYDASFVRPAGTHGRVVAVVGDSFSASYVPHEFHYTTVAERELGTAVWNVGWAGLGPAEYRLLLQRDVLPLEPDCVVVSLFLGNDLLETVPWSGIDRVLAGWFDRGNVLLLEVPRRIWRLVRGTADAPGARRIGDPAAAASWLHDPLQEPGTFAPEAFLQLERERAVAACGLDGARTTAMLHELRGLRDLCAGRPFGFVLIPDEFMIEDGLWRAVGEGIADDARWALRDRLVAFCREEGIECLDLLPALRAVPPFPDGDRHLYLLRDTHWNVRGNRVAGELLAPFVRTLLEGHTPGRR